MDYALASGLLVIKFDSPRVRQLELIFYFLFTEIQQHTIEKSNNFPLIKLKRINFIFFWIVMRNKVY